VRQIGGRREADIENLDDIDHIDHMRKVVSYCKRHLAQEKAKRIRIVRVIRA
jgi:Protein of unknown function (DUF3140)